MLQVADLHTYYAQSHILQGVGLSVEPAEVVCVLGRNGVGKTTLLRSIMGLTRARSGRVVFDGKELTGLAAYEIAALGISYVPQGRGIFSHISVLNNLRLGTIGRNATMARVVPEEIFSLFPLLRERATQKGGTLSGGEQQMLAIARGLASDPKLMLLDEPTEGIQPSLVRKIRETVKELNEKKGVSFLIVEQHLDFALSVSKRCYIMEKGRIVVATSVGDLHPELVKTYLGVS